jgi:hypothetical protein
MEASGCFHAPPISSKERVRTQWIAGWVGPSMYKSTYVANTKYYFRWQDQTKTHVSNITQIFALHIISLYHLKIHAQSKYLYLLKKVKSNYSLKSDLYDHN